MDDRSELLGALASDAALERSEGALEQRLHVTARNRPAIRQAGHLRQDSRRTGSLTRRALRVARERVVAAGWTGRCRTREGHAD